MRKGAFDYLECSNFTGWQLTWALWVSDRRGYAPFVSVQPHYNMLERSVERELLPACAAFGIGVIPFFPLAAGLLTGKYRRGEPVPQGTRFAGRPDLQRQLTEEKLDKVDRLDELARCQGRTVGQLAIAWLLSRPEVSTVIAGATRPEQVEENAAAAAWELDSATLDEVTGILG